MEAQILESRKEVSSPSCGFFFAECEMLAISLSSGLSAIGRQQKKPSSYRRDCLCLLIGSSEQKSTNAASPCSPETQPLECVTRCVCVCVCVFPATRALFSSPSMCSLSNDNVFSLDCLTHQHGLVYRAEV